MKLSTDYNIWFFEPDFHRKNIEMSDTVSKFSFMQDLIFEWNRHFKGQSLLFCISIYSDLVYLRPIFPLHL